MLPLLFAWLTTPAEALEVANICQPNCDKKIVWMEVEIVPEWLVAEERRVGGLRSLEVTVLQVTGSMNVTVNRYPLDARYLVSTVRGYSTYRVPVTVNDTVGVEIENLRGTTLEYDIEIQGSNVAPPP